MEQLTSTQLIAPALEPLRMNRWYFQFAGIDPWSILTFERPAGDFGEINVPYINTVRFWQGKFMPNPSAMTLWDAVTPAASQKLQEWLNLGYEQATGRAGYKEMYAGKNVQLKMLDPTGAVVQMFQYYNFFPTSYNFGALDFGSGEKIVINVSFRYDAVLMMF